MLDSQQPAAGTREGELPCWALVVMALLAGVLMLAGMLRGVVPLTAAAVVILTDGVMALLVLLSAGGFGWGICRFVMPRRAPPLLGLATAAALGLWLLSAAVLVAGSATHGALTLPVWWTVVGAGVALALWQLHRPLADVRFPARLPGRSLIWVVVALAAGQWLAGAVLPPGWAGNLTADSADVLERYAQLPREYYHAGRVATLDHNVYSHSPQCVEMLMLLGMCLRAGAQQGAILAKMIHGLFGLVAVLAVFGGLRREADFRARAAAGLLATAPWVSYLFWPGLIQLAPLCFLTLGLMWLREWLAAPSARSAGMVGACLGAACATGYAAVAMSALPVVGVMGVASLRRPRRVGQLGVTIALTLLLPVPWAVRNAAATANPCFPIATGIFGRGHWSEESVRRWRDAHAPGFGRRTPPGPAGGADDPSPPARLGRFLTGRRPYHLSPSLGAGVVLLLAGTLLAMLIRPPAAAGWEWALLAVAGGQMLAWMLCWRDMPALAVSVCVVPISLLCSGGLSRLAGVKEVRWRWLRQSPAAGGHWGLAPATLLLLVSAVLNLASGWAYFRHPYQLRPWRRSAYPATTMLIGESRAMWFAPQVRYATAFDAQPLEAFLRREVTAAPLAAHLRQAGVTHLFVCWAGIDYLGRRFGWPEQMSPGRLERLVGGWVVEEERWLGARTRPASAPAAWPEPVRMFTLYAVPAAAPATHRASPTTRGLAIPAGGK